MTESELPQHLSVDEGLARVLEAIPELDSETVAVEAALGRVLAEPCAARWPLPGAPLSIMDGYAVHSADLLAARDEHDAETLALELVDESAAGHPAEHALARGSCMRIATGAVVPKQADAVVPQEDTRRVELPGAAEGGGTRALIEFSATALAQVEAGRWIRPKGSDVGEGETLLEAGAPIGPGEASLLAGTGHFEVAVRRRPKVAILSSGDELVPIGQRPIHGQIVSTNAMMLAAQIREAGGEPLDLGLVPDTRAALRMAIERARDEADILVSSGGISVGDHDLVLPVLAELGFACRFRKLRLRPGRPTTYGLLPAPAGSSRPDLPVLALPGNPASTFVAFELLTRPLIRAALGLPRPRWARARRVVELASPAEGDRRRDHYLRARLDADGRARPLGKQLSGALRSIADFDLLVRVPEGQRKVEAGQRLEALILRQP